MSSIKKIVLSFLALTLSESQTETERPKRDYFRAKYPLTDNLQIGGVDVETFGNSGAAYRLFNPVIGTPSQYGPRIRYIRPLQYSKDLSQIDFSTSNRIDKPVRESQDIQQNQPNRAVIPALPPPATPVNALASNVPAVGNSVFLGSGSLGALDLGGGIYVLGSGALGYSERRLNPRGSIKAPLLPPIQAAPNLLPAAVNSPDLSQQTSIQYPIPNSSGSQLPVDQNGYEYLPPDRVGFGDPLPDSPVKTTSVYATPTALQIQPQQTPTSSQDTVTDNVQIFYPQSGDDIYATTSLF